MSLRSNINSEAPWLRSVIRALSEPEAEDAWRRIVTFFDAHLG
jgi:hypothetical protein